MPCLRVHMFDFCPAAGLIPLSMDLLMSSTTSTSCSPSLCSSGPGFLDSVRTHWELLPRGWGWVKWYQMCCQTHPESWDLFGSCPCQRTSTRVSLEPNTLAREASQHTVHSCLDRLFGPGHAPHAERMDVQQEAPGVSHFPKE